MGVAPLTDDDTGPSASGLRPTAQRVGRLGVALAALAVVVVAGTVWRAVSVLSSSPTAAPASTAATDPAATVPAATPPVATSSSGPAVRSGSPLTLTVGESVSGSDLQVSASFTVPGPARSPCVAPALPPGWTFSCPQPPQGSARRSGQPSVSATPCMPDPRGESVPAQDLSQPGCVHRSAATCPEGVAASALPPMPPSLAALPPGDYGYACQRHSAQPAPATYPSATALRPAGPGVPSG